MVAAGTGPGAADVVVVGLGPAGGDLVTPAARRALETARRRFVRTARHPAVADLAAGGLVLEPCDDLYEASGTYDDVYDRVAERVLDAAAAGGPVAFAVPGHPLVAERSVRMVLERAAARGLATRVEAGLSYADLAWARLGVDPAVGTIVDGRDLLAPPPPGPGPVVPAGARAEPSGPTLVFHVTDRLVLAEVKVALLERLPPGTPVTVLHRLGLPDEVVLTVPLAELDHAHPRWDGPDHLTSLHLDAPPGTAAAVARFAGVVAQLRAPGGCPWDADQTHHSLTRHLVEETYEVVEAIDALPAGAPGGEVPPAADDYAPLRDELGDLLYQVVLHAALAEEAGGFTLADVAEGVTAKLVRRHPHVYGPLAGVGGPGTAAGGPGTGLAGGPGTAAGDGRRATGQDLEEVAEGATDAVLRNWERIKRDERGTDSLMSSVPRALPAVLLVQKLLRKASSAGLDLGPGAGQRLVAAARVVADAPDDIAALGELLAGAVVVGRGHDVDAEAALRAWADAFRARFLRMEALAASRGAILGALDAATVAALWDEAAGPG